MTPGAATAATTEPATEPATAPATASATALATASGRYLTVQLGEETYALPVEDVTEILEYRRLTVVPMLPAAIRGVIDLRGRAVPVIDTSLRFGGPALETGRHSAIVILQRGGRAVGALVDAVGAVIHLDHSDVEPPPDLGTGTRPEVVSGMARSGSGFIVIISSAALLSLGDAVTAR